MSSVSVRPLRRADPNSTVIHTKSVIPAPSKDHNSLGFCPTDSKSPSPRSASVKPSGKPTAHMGERRIAQGVIS